MQKILMLLCQCIMNYNKWQLFHNIERNYFRDLINDNENESNVACNRINNNKTISSKSFEYKIKLIWTMPNNNYTVDAEAVAPLKCLSNVWRSFDLPFFLWLTVK